jgi:hypothetical protein
MSGTSNIRERKVRPLLMTAAAGLAVVLFGAAATAPGRDHAQRPEVPSGIVMREHPDENRSPNARPPLTRGPGPSTEELKKLPPPPVPLPGGVAGVGRPPVELFPEYRSPFDRPPGRGSGEATRRNP